MRELILVSKTPIVIQIFILIAKKLNIKLEVLSEAQIDHKVDIIVVDKEFIDDRFNILKTYSRQIGAITNDQLPFELANDFTIPLPFLPSNLQTILENQLQIIIKKANTKTYITSVKQDKNDAVTFEEQNNINNSSDTDELDPALHYLESLANGIAIDIDEESDDSIVSFDPIKNGGGILDSNELAKLEEIIGPTNKSTSSHIKKENNDKTDKSQKDEDEWLDLASIIDQAIYEVNSTNDYYDKEDNHPIKLLLNDYSLNELTPLLNLLNQDIIDQITNGEEITLQLKLGDKNV